MQDVIDFYEEVDGELVVKVRPKTKKLTALEQAINLGKPQPVIDSFAEMVAVGYQWDWFDEYQQYLSDLEAYELARDEFISVSLEDGTVTEFTGVEPVEPVRPAILTGADVYAPYKREVLKKERAIAVNSITVEVDNMVFDGDELSQLRMLRAIMILDDDQTMPWTLADNAIVEVNKSQLTQAIVLAGEIQSALWQIE